VPTASGANSVASALGFRSGATPFGHVHANTTFQQPSSKPDISIWQRRGHFYLALTGIIVLCASHCQSFRGGRRHTANWRRPQSDTVCRRADHDPSENWGTGRHPPGRQAAGRKIG
jgi:hypothetical protein